MAKTQIARIYSPTGGMNTESALDRMPETDAIMLKNVFAETGYIRTRYPSQAITPSGTWNAALAPATVEMLNKPDGTQILVAACINQSANTATIQTLSSFNPASFALTGANVTGTASTSANSYQMTQFSGVGENHAIIGVNGDKNAWYYDGGAAIIQDGGGSWTITGPTSSADLINVAVYKQRLYFVEKDSASFWYGPLYSYAPGGTLSLTEYDVSAFLTKGDAISWVGSLTFDSTYGPQNGFAVVTDSGEILVYGGDYPGSSTWSLTGRYYVAPPMGRNAYFYLGQELHIVTKQGIVPFSQLRTYSNSSQAYLVMSQKVQSFYRDLADERGESNYYWQGVNFPQKSMLIITVPVDTSDPENIAAFVMNTDSGAWSVFSNFVYETGSVTNAAISWFSTKDTLYYLNNSCKPFQVTTAPSNTAVCNGLSKDNFRISCSWNGLGSPSLQKKVNLVQPIISSTAVTTSSSDGTTTEVDVGIGTDFEDNAELHEITLKYSKTQGEETFNKPAVSAAGKGRMLSLNIKGNCSKIYKLYTTDISIETGGIL